MPKISTYGAAATLDGTEFGPVVQAALTKRATVQQLADFARKNATFTGQTVINEMLQLAGVITPAAAIAATQNDYNPPNLAQAAVLRLSSTGSQFITGLAGGVAGRLLFLVNVGVADIVLQHNNAASAAANRFLIGGMDRVVSADRSIALIYDAVAGRWRDGDSLYPATTAQVRGWAVADGAFLTPGNVAAAYTPTALVDAATVTPDLNAGIDFTFLKTMNGTLANPINCKVGQRFTIEVTQDVTGGRTLAYGGAWKRRGGATALSTAANAVDYIVGEIKAVSAGVATKIVYDIIKNPT